MPAKRKTKIATGGQGASTVGGAKGDGIFGWGGDSILNDSKIFAGLMIIILNISSKYVKIKLSPSIETFLKTSVSMYFLIFIMIWVGTKDLISSIVITGICILLIEYLLNEESVYSILPESFTQYYGDNGTTNGINGTKKIKELNGNEIEMAIQLLKSVEKQ